jgi:hypothetical protein
MLLDQRYLAPITAAIALFATPLSAQEVSRGTKLICDTVEQIDAFVRAQEDGQNAMALINAEKPVCGFGQIAYVKGGKVKEVLIKEGTLEVYEILMLGVGFNGMFRPVKPQRQFAVFLAKSEDI